MGHGMGTCVFYIDEAGSCEGHSLPLAPGHSPLFALGAVALPLNQWRGYDRDLLQLKRHYFPDLLAVTSARQEYFEIKGNSLTAPRSVRSERRQAYLKAVLALIAKYGGACFGVSMLKSVESPLGKSSIYTKSIQIMMERFNDFLLAREDYQDGILVCDSRKGMGSKADNIVAKSYLSYIFGNAKGKALTAL